MVRYLQITHFADYPYSQSSLFLFPVKRSRFAAGSPGCFKYFGDVQLVHTRYSSEERDSLFLLSSRSLGDFFFLMSII